MTIDEKIAEFRERFSLSNKDNHKALYLNGLITSASVESFLRESYALGVEEGKKGTVSKIISDIKKLDDTCGVCLKKGVNTQGECRCSYETKGLIRRKDVLAILNTPIINETK